MRDFVGYGEHPPDPQWPNGARLALNFVLNYEEGGENTPLEGDPASEAFLHEVVGAPATVAALEFWRLTGGNPPAEVKGVKADPMAAAAAARDGLLRLVAAFDLPDTAYQSVPDPEFAPRFSDYAHLARVKEWSTGALRDEE